ncbi:MAG: hypothetical protein U0790_22450 [Isosphaeraceae bacterium]
MRTLVLSDAVEEGVVRAESRIIGELSESLIRKSIRIQRATLPFWTTLSLLSDFVAEPLSLFLRAWVVATLLSASAALVGRPGNFDTAFHECAEVQGLWVLGMAVQVALAISLKSSDVDTSMALVLPTGTYPALALLVLKQIGLFAIWGWTLMILGGRRRGQVGLLSAATICGIVAAIEILCRAGFATVTGAAMRLMLLPTHS